MHHFLSTIIHKFNDTKTHTKPIHRSHCHFSTMPFKTGNSARPPQEIEKKGNPTLIWFTITISFLRIADNLSPAQHKSHSRLNCVGVSERVRRVWQSDWIQAANTNFDTKTSLAPNARHTIYIWGSHLYMDGVWILNEFCDEKTMNHVAIRRFVCAQLCTFFLWSRISVNLFLTNSLCVSSSCIQNYF